MIPEPVLKIRTEVELQQVISNGLTETHHVDFKRVVGTSDGAKKDFAQDVAALAIDGGVLIVGVDEPKVGPIQLAPFDLTGEAERLTQIAGMRADEGVQVRTWSVPSSSGANLGYLFVHVPPSPRAPHSVDGKYYGRTDKTNRILSDAEVERLMAQRIAQQRDMVAAANAVLDDLRFDAPSPPPSILLILAEPMGGAIEDPLVPLMTLDDNTRLATVRALLNQASVPEHQQGFNAIAHNVAQVVRRAGAIAATNNMYNSGLWAFGSCAEIWLKESGTVLLAAREAVIQPGSTEPPQLVESLVVGHTDLVVRLAPLLSEQYGFAGAWRFGLLLTETRGATSNALFHASRTGWERRSTPFEHGVYERATSASLVELSEAPEKVVGRLVSSLLRSLDSYQEPQFSWLLP
ncbi:helix-turn-helix domain-containing protein [Mycobacterium paraense]|uniref:AlbA family DNA-binding domain-containing protein n=1 Tax=Mycobacterium paraense TaxID=767916 RepID=UPI001482002C|nr:ATP-binding protein [Mycobacterium paraense]